MPAPHNAIQCPLASTALQMIRDRWQTRMRKCLKQARAQVPPEDYLFVLIDHGETFHCPAVNSNSDAGQITLGDAFMQSYYIDFDRTKGRMGFAPANIDNCGGNTNCGTLHAPASQLLSSLLLPAAATGAACLLLPPPPCCLLSAGRRVDEDRCRLARERKNARRVGRKNARRAPGGRKNARL